MLQRYLAALILLLPLGGIHADTPASFDSGHIAFSLSVRGLAVSYREFALFALPGERVSVAPSDPTAHFELAAGGGEWHDSGDGRWTWHAPAKSGHYALDITRDDGAHMRLEAFVMVPASRVRRGTLNGYHIGHYPAHPRDGLDIYRAPAGFVEVTPALAAVPVSPHFTLGEFLCKESGGYPKYLVLRPELLLKLETLVAYLDSRGVPPGAIHVMSGYRTPWYNQKLGNVEYSRHMWGDAADLYIDAVAGGPREIKGGFLDSRALAADFDHLFSEPEYAYLRGGIGTYPATASHAPFVHVDTRGFDARW